MTVTDPSATSAGDIILAAMKECGAIGVGQTPLAEDYSDGMARLQWMLQEWERKRWLVYRLKTLAVVSTGAQSYTMGPGGQLNTNANSAWLIQSLSLDSGGTGHAVGDVLTLLGSPVPGAETTKPTVTVTAVKAGVITGFVLSNAGIIDAPLPVSFGQSASTGAGINAKFKLPVYSKTTDLTTASSSVRPARIESAFLRQLTQSQPNQIDYSLEILQSREDYNKIALKSLVSFPSFIFYDSDWPLGSVFAWPVPSASIYAIHVTVLDQLPPSFATQATKFNLPFEYYHAMVTNLAVRLMPKYGMIVAPGNPLVALAKVALNTIRGANAQIARLSLPAEISRNGIYNIFSDRFY